MNGGRQVGCTRANGKAADGCTRHLIFQCAKDVICQHGARAVAAEEVGAMVILVIGVPNPRSIPGIVTSRGATALASPVATALASLCTSLCTSQSDASVASEGVLEELESAVELRRRSVIEPERHRPPTRDEERWAIRRDGARRGQGTWRAALITHAASAIEGRAVETRYTLTVAVETRYTLAVAVETRYTLTVETRRPERGEATAAPERRPSRRDL